VHANTVLAFISSKKKLVLDHKTWENLLLILTFDFSLSTSC